MNKSFDRLNLTNSANHNREAWINSRSFKNNDYEKMYLDLLDICHSVHFGERLKLYIYEKMRCEWNRPIETISLEEYQKVIEYNFKLNKTDKSFNPITTKMSALTKNWLTQLTVKREVVFLLGFGLKMSIEDVNTFLEKALLESRINPKDPFELICYYCFKKNYGFKKYRYLWEAYLSLPANEKHEELLSQKTNAMWSKVEEISSDSELLKYLALIKQSNTKPLHSVTAHDVFLSIYNDASTIILNSDFVEDVSLTPSYFEKYLYDCIPKDKHGNLISQKKSSVLCAHFRGKRLSRQRLSKILQSDVKIDRYDIITMNFFKFILEIDEGILDYNKTNENEALFIESTNKYLEQCSMMNLYYPNPYEYFIVSCMRSIRPFDMYEEIIQLSYIDDEGDKDENE